MGASGVTADGACTVIELNLKAMKCAQPEVPRLQDAWVTGTPSVPRNTTLMLRNTIGVSHYDLEYLAEPECIND